MPHERRVLIVEDDDAIAMMVSYLLKSHGYEVARAAGLEEARGRLREFSPEIVLLDILLPDGNGLSYLEELREDPRTRTTPVFIISVLHGKDLRRQALDAGATTFIPKPFRPSELVESLRKALI